MLFRLIDGGVVQTLVLALVDDLLIVRSYEGFMLLRDQLSKFFPVKDLGSLNCYMGCKFERDGRDGTLKISQSSFAASLVKKFDVTSTSDVPASPSVELMPRAADESATTEPYREAVGSMMWLANTTRPDIADAVRSVARHCHDPGVSHWKAVRNILSYIAGTVDLGLVYKRGSSNFLTVYADSSYAPKATDRRSVSGGLVMFCGAAIAWLSRTQRIVSLSSTEAEYIAVSDVLRETIFLRGDFEFIRPVEEI